MGYAVFAQRKLVLTSHLNGYQLQLSQRDNEQYLLATDGQNLKTILTKMEGAQSKELAGLYKDLSNAENDKERDIINAEIAEVQNTYKAQNADIQARIDEIALKENAIQLEKENLQTRISVIQKQLEAAQQAEGQGIEKAAPKFTGVS